MLIGQELRSQGEHRCVHVHSAKQNGAGPVGPLRTGYFPLDRQGEALGGTETLGSGTPGFNSP